MNKKLKDLAQFLVDETPKFDEEIMSQIRPASSWMCGGTYEEWLENRYIRTLIKVRSISENAVNAVGQDAMPKEKTGYVDWGTMPVGTPTEITQDRFKSVWANTTKPWNKSQ